jgi:hypothetical protein
MQFRFRGAIYRSVRHFVFTASPKALNKKETKMKTAIKFTALALGLMFSTTAFADNAKPTKPVKVDTMTTQSIEPMVDATQCNKEADGYKTVKLCGGGSAYPVNPLSGMNLGY